MGRKSLTPSIPPTLAVAEGASSPNPGGAGAVIWSSTTSAYMVWNGSIWSTIALFKDNIQRVLLGSDQSNNTTSLGDTTGMSFSVLSGVRYWFKFWCVFTCAATGTGLQLAVNGPTVNTDGLAFNVLIPITDTTIVQAYRRAYNTATTGTGVGTANVAYLATLEGYIYPSASGTLQLRHCSDAASSAAVVKAGSFGELRALATSAPASFENTPIGIDTVSGTTYTIVQGDQGRLKECTNSSAVTVTIPPNSTTAFPIGATVSFEQNGTGQVTLAPGSGVTLNNALTLKTRARYSVLTATKKATDTWLVTGDMATS